MIKKYMPKNIIDLIMIMGVILWLIILGTFVDWVISHDNKEQKNDKQIEPQAQNVRQELPEPAESVPSGSGSAEETWSKQDHECLSLNIYHESRSDSFAGRIAVADVTLNRIDSNLFPDTICEVVQQAKTRVNWKGNIVPVRGMCHFSWYCDGMSDDPLEEDAWEESKIIADIALQGGWRGISEGATHYHATYVEPNWINDRGMVPVGRIGQHKFYRWH